MKKLLGIIVLGLLWCNVGFAECIKGDCNNGHGTNTWADGSKYVGEFKDGKGNGQGTYTFASGSKYVGEFKDGNKHGQGTYTYHYGDKYVGEFKDNKMHGRGTYTWASGEKYVGEYKDDKRQGEGTFTRADGTVDKGIWENNELVKPPSEKLVFEKLYNDENLVGKKLYCEDLNAQTPFSGIEFYAENKARFYWILLSKFEIKQNDVSYVPDPIYIRFYQDGTLLSRLNRSTLEWADKKCILLDENDNVKSRLDKVLENIKNKAKAKNKI